MKIDFQPQAGTIKDPQHTQSSEFRWDETQLVHFPDGFVTPIPSFSASGFNVGDGSLFTGTCRSQWTSRLEGSNQGVYNFFGTQGRLYVAIGGKLYNITPLQTASVALGSNPLATVNTTAVITVTQTAHGYVTGDRVKLSGAATTNGIPNTEINAEHIITRIDDNSYTITVSTDATSTASGGGASVIVFGQIAAGNENQDDGRGWGYGIWGYGIWGAPLVSATAQSYPRIWSFDNFGNEIVMCPGDYLAGDGQKVYIWDGDTSIAPTVLANAPTNCNWVSVINNSVVALCEDKIRISELGDATVWTGATTTTIDVQRASRLISSHSVGEKAAIVFSPEPYYLSFSGGEWDLVELGAQYPIMSPLSACPLNDGLIWYSDNGRLCYFNGSSVDIIVNRQNGEFLRRQVSAGAQWTAFMMSDPKHRQVWFFYPSTGNTSPNKYMIFNPDTESFTLGALSRSSASRPNKLDQQFYMTGGDDIYSHFNNTTASFAWSASSAFFYVDGSRRYRVTDLEGDIYQGDDFTIAVNGKSYPQSPTQTFAGRVMSAVRGVTSIRAAGALLQVAVNGTGDMTLRGLKINVTPLGKRRGG